MDSADEEARTACGDALLRIRLRAPLVHLISNHITADATANAVAALGGRSINTTSKSEVKQAAAAAAGLLINLGTPGVERRSIFLASLKAAQGAGTPIVLDPVGCSFFEGRLKLSRKLLRSKAISVVKANVSEGGALVGRSDKQVANPHQTNGEADRADLGMFSDMRSKEISEVGQPGSGFITGVDANPMRQDGQVVAKEVMRLYGTQALITGALDWISSPDGDSVSLGGGHSSSGNVGTGCISGAVVTCFLGAGLSERSGALAASWYMKRCLFLAAREYANGPGSVALGLINFLRFGLSNWKDFCTKIDQLENTHERRSSGGHGEQGMNSL